MRSDSLPRPLVVRPLEASLTPEFLQSLRNRQSRDRFGLYVAEGLRNLIAAADAQACFAGLIACPHLFEGPIPHSILGRLRRAGAPIVIVAPREIEELSQGADAQGVLAILRQPWEPLPVATRRNDLWLAVESVRFNGNLGTLLRSADAAGASGILVFGGSRTRPDPFDPAVVRASMGSLFGHRFVATSLREFRRWRLRYEVTVIGATPDAAADYRSVTYRRPTVLMLGDERDGLSEAQRATCDGFVRIPMKGRPDSLNLAMAGTVLLYEAYNQRHPVSRRPIAGRSDPGCARPKLSARRRHYEPPE